MSDFKVDYTTNESMAQSILEIVQNRDQTLSNALNQQHGRIIFLSKILSVTLWLALHESGSKEEIDSFINNVAQMQPPTNWKDKDAAKIGWEKEKNAFIEDIKST